MLAEALRLEYEEAVIYRVLNEAPEFVTKTRPEVPSRLDQIIQRAIAKDPSRRYQTADALCADLEAESGERAGGRRSKAIFGRLGRRQRKIAARILPLAIVLIAVYFLLRGAHGSGLVPIVLLPLENITHDEGEEWFTDGMTDALITAMDLMYVRRYDEVIQLLRKTLETSPGEPIALSAIRSAYYQKKMYDEALEAWRRSFEAKGDRAAIQALTEQPIDTDYST